MNRLLICLALILVVAGSSVSAWADEKPKEESPLVCWSLPALMHRYLENHVSHREMNEKMTDRVVTLFAERFDSSKSLLLAAEFADVKKRVSGLVADALEGRCDQFSWLKANQVKWHQEMESFVRASMAETKEVDRTIELIVDPDKRAHPKTTVERAELRRKLLHFQLANYVRSGTKLDEAKSKLIHRYELVTKRITELTEADLYASFLNAFANALDPHSTYFSADDLADFRITMDLSLEGIGAVLSSRDGYTSVAEVVPGGAADRQGDLKTKDKIIAVAQGVDGEAVDVIDMSLRDVVKKIRGKKGTKVKLTVLRQGEKTETLTIVITRDKIDLKEQAAKLRWETIKRDGKKHKLAILDLPSFYGGDQSKGARNCYEDVRRLLAEVEAGNADGLLLDLSRNGGGLLKAAVDISGLFLARGAMVAIDGPATPQQRLEDEDRKIQFSRPMVVLTSRASASASEILAGALKDYGRAVIVGDDHTFGKGTVQNIIGLPPGFGALKVTTALFFRPGGQSTQSRGVAGDIIVPSYFGNGEHGERHQPFSLPSRSMNAFKSVDVNVTDPSVAWKKVTAAQIEELRKRSTPRQAENKGIQEIVEVLEKRAKNKGIVKIAEIFDEKDDDEEENAHKKDDEELSPRAREGLQILADLVSLSD